MFVTGFLDKKVDLVITPRPHRFPVHPNTSAPPAESLRVLPLLFSFIRLQDDQSHVPTLRRSHGRSRFFRNKRYIPQDCSQGPRAVNVAKARGISAAEAFIASPRVADTCPGIKTSPRDNIFAHHDREIAFYADKPVLVLCVPIVPRQPR